MRTVETWLERHRLLPKWDILIRPVEHFDGRLFYGNGLILKSNPMSSLTQRAASGVRCRCLAVRPPGNRLYYNSVLARALAPTDLADGNGLGSNGICRDLQDLGTSAAIVQRKDLSPNLLSSIFWVNVVRLAVTLLVIGLSPARESISKSLVWKRFMWTCSHILHLKPEYGAAVHTATRHGVQCPCTS